MTIWSKELELMGVFVRRFAEILECMQFPTSIPFWQIPDPAFANTQNTLAHRHLLCSDHTLYVLKASFVLPDIIGTKYAQKCKQDRIFFSAKACNHWVPYRPGSMQKGTRINCSAGRKSKMKRPFERNPIIAV